MKNALCWVRFKHAIAYILPPGADMLVISFKDDAFYRFFGQVILSDQYPVNPDELVNENCFTNLWRLVRDQATSQRVKMILDFCAPYLNSIGFAYRYDAGVQKGLLTGKTAVIINSHGKSNEEYSKIGMDKALSLTSDRGVYIYSGLAIRHHSFLDQADRATAENVEAWDRSIRNLYRTEE